MSQSNIPSEPPGSEFTTKFSELIAIRPAVIGDGDWYVTISVSDAISPNLYTQTTIDLCLRDARDLAIALYHAVCYAEAIEDRTVR